MVKTDDSEIGDYLNYMEQEMGKAYFEKHYHRIVNLFFGIDSDADLEFERRGGATL